MNDVIITKDECRFQIESNNKTISDINHLMKIINLTGFINTKMHYHILCVCKTNVEMLNSIVKEFMDNYNNYGVDELEQRSYNLRMIIAKIMSEVLNKLEIISGDCKNTLKEMGE